MMGRQEVFDRVASHLMMQQARSVHNGPPRELYHPKFHDDAHEKAERDAMYAAMDACKKAATVERKTLTTTLELVT